jgi:hypothetical protein
MKAFLVLQLTGINIWRGLGDVREYWAGAYISKIFTMVIMWAQKQNMTICFQHAVHNNKDTNLLSFPKFRSIAMLNM